MSVKYKLIQDLRKGSTNYGKWYGRASYDKDDIINTEQLAEKIAYATTVTDVDAEAVIKALCRFMREALLEGKKVELTKFGTFKCGLRTKGADTAKDFSANSNVTGVRVLFQPYATKDKTSGRFIKGLIFGIKVIERGMYNVDKEDGDDGDVVEP